MAVITEPAVLDEQTGMLVEIVRDADTGEIIGKNEWYPEPEQEAE
jgi:hypothetical protein